jgi:flagellar hook assembly protein FlgD
VAGRRVRRLWDAPLRTASATLVWDGRDDRGQPAASGTYFVRASTASDTLTVKLTLLK